jgi:hypothetical protein
MRVNLAVACAILIACRLARVCAMSSSPAVMWCWPGGWRFPSGMRRWPGWCWSAGRGLKRTQDHDPVPDALRLRCPHLAVFGGADELVSVADSARRFSAAACHPGRHHQAALTIEVFPGASHRIQVDASADPAPGYLGILAQWIEAKAAISDT